MEWFIRKNAWANDRCERLRQFETLEKTMHVKQIKVKKPFQTWKKNLMQESLEINTEEANIKTIHQT